MTAINVVDSTWVAAPAPAVAALVADPDRWGRWWPGLDLRVSAERGSEGMKWAVASVREGRGTSLSGEAEVWLQPMFDGVVAHFFLRVDPVAGSVVSPRLRSRVVRRYRARAKQVFWEIADLLDRGRADRLRAVGPSPDAVAPERGR